jgi:hypothetical protein
MTTWTRRHRKPRELVRIFRIEDKNGWGPYSALAYTAVHGAPFDDRRHPLPPKDGNGFAPEAASDGVAVGLMAFGFRDLDQLRHWFCDDDLALLGMFDFVIATYDVPSRYAIHGIRQSGFAKNRAHRRSTRPIAP